MLARTRLVPLINSVRGFCTLYGEDFWNSEAAVNRLDLTPYGDELAVRVIERIDNGRFIGSVHQGYCGWALGKHRNCGLYILGRPSRQRRSAVSTRDRGDGSRPAFAPRVRMPYTPNATDTNQGSSEC